MATRATAPEAIPHHGQILVTATSGGEKVQLLLTRNAASMLSHRLSAAIVVAFAEDRDAEPIPFKARKARKPA